MVWSVFRCIYCEAFQNLVNYFRVFVFLFLVHVLSHSVWAQTAKDCRDFITVCSSTTLALNANGVGTLDFNNPNNQIPPCYQNTGPNIENNSLWLKIPIATDGTLEFTLVPEADLDDFDFMVYGPNPNCNNLGLPIRCSTSSPDPRFGSGTKRTGLSGSVFDETEGPGSGDGFVASIDVKAGEEYILFIDRFTQANNSFDFELGGTASITPPPVANSPGEVEYCDPDGDDSLLINLFELDNQLSGGASNVGVSYFTTERDALQELNRIPSRNYLLNVNEQELWAKVTNNVTGCFALTSFDVKLTSLQPNNDITGPRSVCPTVERVPYATLPTNADTYEWFVEGGDITSGQGTTDILINWGNTNDNAMVKVVGKTSNGCVSDTTYFPVRVNRRLEPETPRGPVQVCYNERQSTGYEVPLVPGSIYEWGVINGRIVGTNDQNAVEVNWDGFTGTGRVFFREFNPGIAECEGFSDTLDVQLFTEILVNAQVTEPLCSGANNGSIQLTVSGGAVGAVDFTWDDVTTNTDLRENLSPGIYNYTINDQLGCLTSGSVTITEPPPISLNNVIPVDASCFQSSDGGLLATITGGTGAYRYRVNGQTIPLDRDQIEIRNLPRGAYDLDILDDNDCQFTLPFTVEAPELLEADLQSLLVIDACPQQATGAISLEAIGGTPDYQFTWSPNIGQDGNAVTDLNKGDYTVTIVDMNNCQASLTVTVGEVQPRVQLPNAFSPNSDAENDLFLPLSNCPLGNYRFSVFNRWGTLVFSTTDQNTGWDGSLEGKPAPTGRYSYLVSYTILLEDVLVEESLRGVVRIFR